MTASFAAVPGAVVDDGVPAAPRQSARRAARARRRHGRRARSATARCSPCRARTACRGWTRSPRRRSPASRPGESTELLVLDPQGRVEHAPAVLDDGETTWLIVDREDAEGAARVAAPDALPAAGRPAGRARRVRRGRGHRRPGASAGAAARRWSGPTRGRRSLRAAGATPSSTPHPGAGPRLGRGHRLARGGARSPPMPRPAAVALAGADAADALRIAAWRPRWCRGRRAHDPARARLAAHRRAPEQGLLPRAGDGREGAQPRPPAAPARGAAARRQRQRSARAAAPRCARATTSSASSPRSPCTSRRGRSRSRVVRRSTPVDADARRSTPTTARSPPRRRSSCRRRRARRRASRGCRGSAVARAPHRPPGPIGDRAGDQPAGATASHGTVTSPSRQRERSRTGQPAASIDRKRRLPAVHRAERRDAAARSHSASSAGRKRVHALARDVAVDERLRQSLGGDRRAARAPPAAATS